MRNLQHRLADLDVALLAAPSVRRDTRDIPSGPRVNALLDAAEGVLAAAREAGLAPLPVPPSPATKNLFELADAVPHPDYETDSPPVPPSWLGDAVPYTGALGIRVERVEVDPTSAWRLSARDDLND